MQRVRRLRQDLTHIQKWIAPGSRVLDLGCGDGSSWHSWWQSGRCAAWALRSMRTTSTAIGRGWTSSNRTWTGAGQLPDNSFDTVVMLPLQAVPTPTWCWRKCYVSAECIVPSHSASGAAGHLGRGRMPVSKFLPYAWYDTPNIHFCTVRDFEALCAERIFASSVATDP